MRVFMEMQGYLMASRREFRKYLLVIFITGAGKSSLRLHGHLAIMLLNYLGNFLYIGDMHPKVAKIIVIAFIFCPLAGGCSGTSRQRTYRSAKRLNVYPDAKKQRCLRIPGIRGNAF